MVRIDIEDFDVCHQLAEDIKHLPLLKERNLMHITHIVSCDEFVIFISYNKSSFGDKIQKFVQDVIKTSQRSSLYKYGWAVHRSLILDNLKAEAYSEFSYQIQIIITVK